MVRRGKEEGREVGEILSQELMSRDTVTGFNKPATGFMQVEDHRRMGKAFRKRSQSLYFPQKRGKHQGNSPRIVTNVPNTPPHNSLLALPSSCPLNLGSTGITPKRLCLSEAQLSCPGPRGTHSSRATSSNPRSSRLSFSGQARNNAALIV